MDRILRIDMKNLTALVEPLPEAYWDLGGRSMTSRIVCDEVDPGCDPMGPHNKLVFAPGLLSGTVLSSSSRLSVGCKSPLTGGIKESNAGGQSGLKMAMLGYRAMVVSGMAEPGAWWTLVVERDGARFEPAGHLVGLNTYEIAEKLFAQFGKKVGLSILGPAGQKLMNLAGICNTDPEGRPSRLNARGGVGAVMGGKGLLAVVWNEPGYTPVRSIDPESWKDAARGFAAELRAQPATAERYPKLGTAGVLEVVLKFGGLPIKNFSTGADPRAEAITGINMRETILERGGETTHSCMTGCAIQCSNVWVDKAGKEVASSMEFESNGLLGSNLEIFDFDAIARFTRLCNELGVDSIEAGGVMGIAMEAGLIPWGDVSAVEKAFEEIRLGTPFGRLLGLGAGLAGRALGVRRVPVVKNQTISAYDPRVIKGNAVTYCTTAMGADHTAGNTIGAKTDHLDPADKLVVSREAQIGGSLTDAFGFCNFTRGVYGARPELFAQLYEARLGKPISAVEMRRYAALMNRMELEFNRRAGQPVVERLPEWMREETLPPHNSLFDVTEDEMARLWDDEAIG